MKAHSLRKLCVWLMAVIGGFWTLSYLSACNTVEGVGEDIEDVGEEIEDAAD